jgi:hypothetical protein
MTLMGAGGIAEQRHQMSQGREKRFAKVSPEIVSKFSSYFCDFACF